MYPASFDYSCPKSLEEAIGLLREHGQAKLLAGGHSLIPLMKQRLTDLTRLVDLRAIGELKGIRPGDGVIEIGAMTTHWEVMSSGEVAELCPVLKEVAGGIGDPQVRNFGTIGGSLVHADPGADYPAIALATDAELVCAGAAGERRVKATGWFRDVLSTDIGEDEILTAVRFPRASPNSGAAYIKIPDPASRMAMLGVAVWLQLDGQGACSGIGIGVTGICSVPGRAASVEQALQGKTLTEERIGEAARSVTDDIEVEPSLTSELADREELCRTITRRAIALALSRASAS